MRGMRLAIVLGVLLGAVGGRALAVEKKPFRDDVKTAADGVTKGWLVEYPWPDQEDASQSWRTIAGRLVVSHRGHVIRRIEGGATIWGWNFWAGGKEVVYETGPVHGMTSCVRMDLGSGKVVEEWPGDCRDVPESAPAWVKAAGGGK